jgi:isocitrate dehydrogenase
LKLTLITNRGVKVWPGGIPETFCIDHWRCRYEGKGPVKCQRIASFLHELADAGFDICQTQNLYRYDGQPGYSNVNN